MAPACPFRRYILWLDSRGVQGVRSNLMSVRATTDAAPLAFPLAPIPIYLPAWQPHLLSAPPGGGKTCLTAWLVARLLSGTPVFGHESRAVPWAGVIAADRPWDDTCQWYRKAGLEHIPHFSLIDSQIPLKRIRQQDTLIDLLDSILDTLGAPPNGLVVIDPISLWAGGDMNRYMAVYVALVGLNRLCQRRQLTIIGLAHTSKQKGDEKTRYTRPQDRINGSAALLGCSGTQMALEGPDQTGTDLYRFTWQPHHAPAESHDLDRDQDSGLFVPAGSMIPKHSGLLVLIPTDDPLSIPGILRLAALQQIDLSRATLYRLLDQWEASGVLEKVSRGLYRRVLVN